MSPQASFVLIGKVYQQSMILIKLNQAHWRCSIHSVKWIRPRGFRYLALKCLNLREINGMLYLFNKFILLNNHEYDLSTSDPKVITTVKFSYFSKNVFSCSVLTFYPDLSQQSINSALNSNYFMSLSYLLIISTSSSIKYFSI